MHIHLCTHIYAYTHILMHSSTDHMYKTSFSQWHIIANVTGIQEPIRIETLRNPFSGRMCLTLGQQDRSSLSTACNHALKYFPGPSLHVNHNFEEQWHWEKRFTKCSTARMQLDVLLYETFLPFPQHSVLSQVSIYVCCQRQLTG